MILNAEDLVGTPLVFALAQMPHTIENGGQIASLAPIMNLQTGDLISPDPAAFPASGYVFWWSVPTGDWNPGDIIVGTIQQSPKYGEANQDWYQVHSNNGSAVRNEVFDSVEIRGDHPDGYRWLIDGRHRFKSATVPSSVFYVWTNLELIGPFHAADAQNENACVSYICTPADTTGGIVKRYSRNAIVEGLNLSRRNLTITISMNDASPRRFNSVDRERHYSLIRREELERWESFANPLTLLPDELIVSRACKRIAGRSKRREVRDQIEVLISEIKKEDAANENEVLDGLAEILGRVTLSESMTDRIVSAFMKDGDFENRIETAVSDQVNARARERAHEIEDQAQQEASGKIAELSKLEEEIQTLKYELENMEKILRETEERRVEEELRAEELLSAVNKKLQSGRDELLSELALLGPIFQRNDTIQSRNNGNDASPKTYSEVPNRNLQVSLNQSGSSASDSSPLSEFDFVRRRLWSCLVNHGCALGDRDAEYFHIAMLSSRLVGVPHPGWVSGYTDAMGGTASIKTISVEPTWLNFNSAFSGELSNVWKRAIRDPDHLHFIVLEGIDRCPTHAWLRPWLSILAGWSHCLPGDEGLNWPDHIRLCITEEKSTSSFELSDEVQNWILNFKPLKSGEIPSPAQEGYFPLESWWLKTSLEQEETFDGFIKTLDLPMGEPYTRARIELAFRLRDALLRWDLEDASRVEKIISERFFSCWSAESTE